MTTYKEPNLYSAIKNQLKKLLGWRGAFSKLTHAKESTLEEKIEKRLNVLIEEKLKHHFGFRLPIIFSKNDQVLIHTIDNQRLFLDARELFMTLHLLEHGEWETHIRSLLRGVLTNGSLFVDIGANIGVHTLFAAALVGKSGKILALEPHPITRELLRTNLEINGFLDRTEIYAQAATHCDDALLSFEYFVEHPAMSGFKVAKERIKKFSGTSQTIDVKTITVDTLLKNNNFDSILVKIDVEGFEYDVLRGCKQAIVDHPNISFIIEYEKEVAESVMYPNVIQDISKFFNHHGFIPFQVNEKGLRALTFEQLAEEAGENCRFIDYYFIKEQNLPKIKHLILPPDLDNTKVSQ